MKKRILVLTSTFPEGDDDTQPNFIKGLCVRLAKNHEVFVLAPSIRGKRIKSSSIDVSSFRYSLGRLETLAGGQGIIENLRQRPINYLMIPLFMLGMFARARKIIKSERIDVIHAHWIIPQGLVAVALKLLFPGIKLVITSHGGDLYALKGRFFRALKRYVIIRSDVLTVVSSAMKAFCVRELGIKPNKIFVQSMGIDTQNIFYPLGEKDPRQIVFVGRLVEKKGLDVLLQSCKELYSRKIPFRLTVIGGGERLTGYIDMAERLGVSELVKFEGAQPPLQVAKTLQRSYIAAFPFRVDSNGDQEGLGLTMIEAMACGCAVVATDLPAISDVITDGYNGVIVASENPIQLADALESLLLSNSRVESLVSVSRVDATSRFDWVRVGDCYSQIIEQAAGQ